MDWIPLAQDRDQWRHLWTRQWLFWFYKLLGSSWVAERLGFFQEGLSSMELQTVMEPIWARRWEDARWWTTGSFWIQNIAMCCWELHGEVTKTAVWLTYDDKLHHSVKITFFPTSCRKLTENWIGGYRLNITYCDRNTYKYAYMIPYENTVTFYKKFGKKNRCVLTLRERYPWIPRSGSVRQFDGLSRFFTGKADGFEM
jgi:hypothetical protein